MSKHSKFDYEHSIFNQLLFKITNILTCIWIILFFLGDIIQKIFPFMNEDDYMNLVESSQQLVSSLLSSYMLVVTVVLNY